MRRVLLVLLLLVVGAGLFLWLSRSLDGLVARGIEQVGAELLGTRVSVGGVSLDLRKGSGTIRGLRVANPTGEGLGFSRAPAFALDEITVALDPRSLSGGGPLVVKQLRVAHPRVNAEVAGRALNLDVLRRRASSKTTEEVTEAEGGRRTAGEPLRIVVRHFVFEEGQVELRIEGKDERTRDLVLPSMSLRNVGGERGATPAELGKTLLAGLLSHAAATVGKERALGEAERWIDEKLEGEPAAAGAAKRVLEGLLGGDEPQP